MHIRTVHVFTALRNCGRVRVPASRSSWKTWKAFALGPPRLAEVKWCLLVCSVYVFFDPDSSRRRWPGDPMEMICSMSEGRLCFLRDGRGVEDCGQLFASNGGASLESLLAFLSSLSGGRGVATSSGMGYPEPGGLCGNGRLDLRVRES